MWQYNYTPSSDDIMHYGVLGMKWGHRKKYYTSSGTLNSLGKARKNYENAKKILALFKEKAGLQEIEIPFSKIGSACWSFEDDIEEDILEGKKTDFIYKGIREIDLDLYIAIIWGNLRVNDNSTIPILKPFEIRYEMQSPVKWKVKVDFIQEKNFWSIFIQYIGVILIIL